MATKANGQVLERPWKRGRGYALRFSAYGERRYLTLGFEQDGWTKERAEEELANVMADVRRGIWVPPKKSSKRSGQKRNGSQVREMPLFGAFSRGLIEARRGQVSENTTHYEKRTVGHLCGYFADWPLDQIDVEAVDATGFTRSKSQIGDAARLSGESLSSTMAVDR